MTPETTPANKKKRPVSAVDADMAALAGALARFAQTAAVISISTFHSGRARPAMTVARGGVWPAATQASQAVFMPAKSARSARKISARRMRVLSVPARPST